MKRVLYFLVAIVLLLLTNCYPSVDNKKEQMLSVYSNENNYILLTGEIIEILDEDYRNRIIIKHAINDDVKINDDSQNEYLIFSQVALEIAVGDTIEYKTVFNKFGDYLSWYPIVYLEKENQTLLEFQSGKSNLLSWVKQLQGK